MKFLKHENYICTNKYKDCVHMCDIYADKYLTYIWRIQTNTTIIYTFPSFTSKKASRVDLCHGKL